MSSVYNRGSVNELRIYAQVSRDLQLYRLVNSYLPPNQKESKCIMLEIIVFLAKKDGYCYVSESQLAKLLGVSRGTITNNKKWFVSKGLIEVSNEYYKRCKKIYISGEAYKRALIIWGQSVNQTCVNVGIEELNEIENLAFADRVQKDLEKSAG